MHPRVLRGRAGGGHPGPRRRRIVLRHFGTRLRRGRRHARRPGRGAAARGEHDRRRDPVQRVAGADVRGRHARQGRRLPGGVREVGGAGRRHRRGHRLRTAGDHLPRRDRRRRSAADGGPRRPGLPAADRAARRLRMLCRPTPLPPCHGPATDELGRAGAADGRLRPTCAPAAGSPTSTTGTSAATPCWRSRRTPGWSGCRTTPTLGLAMATDCNCRYTVLDPYRRRAAGAGRGVPQRGRRAAHGRSRSPTA